MRHSCFTLLLACLLIAGCGGAATAHAANGPTGGALACSVRFNGVGLDFAKYHLNCIIHANQSGDTAYKLTGQLHTSRGTLFQLSWCQAQLAHGAATCQGDFVIIVPIHAPSVTITAHFLPSNGTAQTNVAIPQG